MPTRRAVSLLTKARPKRAAPRLPLQFPLGHFAATFGRMTLRPHLRVRQTGWVTAADLPVICVVTRHMQALLTAQQINETDRNDARGTMMPSYSPPTISPATRTLTLSAFPGR